MCWTEVGETVWLGPDLVQETTERIKVIKQHLFTAQSRQKNYVDRRRKTLSFDVGDYVCLKLSLLSGVKKGLGRLENCHQSLLDHLEILERVGEVAYKSALPPQLSNVHDVFLVSMLRKYEPDPIHFLN